MHLNQPLLWAKRYPLLYQAVFTSSIYETNAEISLWLCVYSLRGGGRLIPLAHLSLNTLWWQQQWVYIGHIHQEPKSGQLNMIKCANLEVRISPAAILILDSPGGHSLFKGIANPVTIFNFFFVFVLSLCYLALNSMLNMCWVSMSRREMLYPCLRDETQRSLKKLRIGDQKVWHWLSLCQSSSLR